MASTERDADQAKPLAALPNARAGVIADPPKSSAAAEVRVCTNPKCSAHGTAVNGEGMCETCWGPSSDESPPVETRRQVGIDTAVDGGSGRAAPALNLRRAERVHEPTLRALVDGEVLTAERIPRDLHEVVRPAIRSQRVRGGWEATWWDPAPPAIPFHLLLSSLKTSRERIAAVTDLLDFLGRIEGRRVPAFHLFDDAVWIDPARRDDFMVLAGTPSGRSWASAAARCVFSSWLAASHLVCDAATDDDALRWLHLLRAVNPPLPPDAVGLLRDAMCEEHDVAWLAGRWSDLATRSDKETVLDPSPPFRLGAAQRSGRRKGPDTLLPGEYQQDRSYCARVRVGNADALLLALADGVSTADYGSGSKAATCAIAAVEAASPEFGDDVEGGLRALIARAHDAVMQYASSVRGSAPADAHGPASTLTLALVRPDGRVDLAWVGDTPAYGWSPTSASLVPLTFEQHVQLDAVIQGSDARTARETMGGTHLAQCLGAPTCEPAVASWRLSAGAGLVLATDGFVEGFASDQGAGRLARAERTLGVKLAQLCGSTGHLQVACEDLCALSDAGDGRDNLTILAAFAGRLPAPQVREDKPTPNSKNGLSGTGTDRRR